MPQGPDRQRHIQAPAIPENKLRVLPHQVLIIHGREDRILPPSSGLKLHSLINRSELHVFGQCGHWTQIEKKDRFAQLAEKFVSR